MKKFIIIIIIVVLAIGALLLRSHFNKVIDIDLATTTPTKVQVPVNTPAATSTVYTNTQYGFSITLPLSWTGFTVISDPWQGTMLDKQANKLTGPKLLIRHPLWTEAVPHQDIPVMIFTPDQWSLITQEKLAVSAAPIGPSELGRNTQYIFALPARYNFAYPVGFEEVQAIIDSKSFHASF